MHKNEDGTYTGMGTQTENDKLLSNKTKAGGRSPGFTSSTEIMEMKKGSQQGGLLSIINFPLQNNII